MRPIQSSRYLIQQGLEQVEVALVNQGDAHIGLGQGFAGMHPCKAAANDDHMRGITQPLSWRFKFQKVMVARHLQPIGVPSEGYELQSGLAVLNGSASDQLEPFEKEAV